MSDTKTDIMKIWRECFPSDSREWMDMYFTREYDPSCAMTVQNEEGLTVSSLLLQPYTMSFHGHTAGMSYISGAATLRRYRTHGHMSALMQKALLESHSRGDMICALIPATERLYSYYRKKGFATVFYTQDHRYTSAHVFPYSDEYTDADTSDMEAMYRSFVNMTALRPCTVQHSARQFGSIMADNRLSGGVVTAIREGQSDHITAMAWAVPDSTDTTVKVTDILAENPLARQTVLHRIKKIFPDRPITVMDTPPDNSASALTPRGMARIIRADQLLTVMAEAYPQLKTSIRLTDPIIEANNATFHLPGDGTMTILPANDNSIRPDYDISVDVLCRLIFSPATVASITGIPSVRPFMSLMLD